MHFKRRVIVTGGAGFFGASLIKRLLSLGDDVLVLDVESPSNHTPLHAFGLTDAVQYVQADIREGVALAPRCGGPFDVFFHLAAQPISMLSNKEPQTTISINAGGTASALDLFRATRSSFFILASSACAYGVPEPADCPLVEDAPLRRGLYWYTRSKQEAERIAQSAGGCAMIGRFANLYGPGDRHFSRIVPKTLRLLLAARPPVLTRSSGESVLDFLYVEDAVEGLLAMAEACERDRLRDCSGGTRIFNFGTREPLKVSKLISLIGTAFDGEHHEFIRSAQPTEPVMAKFLSAERARRELAWQPAVSRGEALCNTIFWYREHLHSIEHMEDMTLPKALGEAATRRSETSAITWLDKHGALWVQ